jgi:hypothetical protein
MGLALLGLSFLACGGADGPKHWVQWERSPLPGDAEGLRAELYCGDYLFANGTRFDAETGEEKPISGGIPGSALDGSLSCNGGSLFAFSRSPIVGYRSVDGQPFEAMEPPVEGSQINSVLASEARGVVYRSIFYASDPNLPAQIQISQDNGESWESAGISVFNPGGGASRTVNLLHVDTMLAFAVLDEERFGGEIRTDFEGKELLSSVNSFDVDYAMPLPVMARDGQALAVDAWSPGLDQPEYGLQHYYKTDGDPFVMRAEDYEPLLHAGLFLWGVPAANDMPRVVQDTQGRLVVLTDGVAYRSTHDWSLSSRDLVIQDKDCERLEWSKEKFGDKAREDGPGQVTLSHSGGEMVMVAVLVDNAPEWSGPLEEGEEMTLTSDEHPVLLMSESGVCLEVLVAGEDTEVDVGSL